MWPFSPTSTTEHGYRRLAILFAVGLIAIVAASIWLLGLDSPAARRSNPRTTNAYVGGDVTPISARVSGYLKRLPIADNQFVHAGDLLAEIESDDYRARVDGAAAQVSAADARLVVLDQQLRQLEAETRQSRSAQQAAQADLTSADPELRRQRALIKTDLGVARNLEAAEAAAKKTAAGIEAAAANVDVREQQAKVLNAERDAAAAALAARQADLDLAKINLGWTRIVAPIDGTLGARRVREGDLITPGRALVELTPLDGVWVDANFTERQITYIHPGDTARLELDTFPDAKLEGRVIGLSPTTGGALSAIVPDNTTGNYTKVVQRVPVRIAIVWRNGDPRGLVRPGMSVVATVLTDDSTGRP